MFWSRKKPAQATALFGEPPTRNFRTNAEKQQALKNALVMRIDCEGCMASDHQFRWIGRVVGFEESHHCPGGVARIQVIKRDRSGDWRDDDQGIEKCAVADGALQELSPGFFIKYY